MHYLGYYNKNQPLIYKNYFAAIYANHQRKVLLKKNRNNKTHLNYQQSKICVQTLPFSLDFDTSIFTF